MRMQAKKTKSDKWHPLIGTALSVGMFVVFSTLWSFLGPFLTWAFGFETRDTWWKDIAYSLIYFGPMVLAIVAAWYLSRSISGKVASIATALICVTMFIPFIVVIFMVIDQT